MPAKRIATIVLLVYVGASLAALAARHLRPNRSAVPVENWPGTADTLLVCFFHGDQRCPSCRAIEAYAREVVEGRFAGDLKAGRLQWRDVNFDEPANEHFRDDYRLPDTAAVVLVQIRGGAQAGAKNLSDIWLLQNDKKAFVAMIQSEVETLLGPYRRERT
jgi:hypothetical protein